MSRKSLIAIIIAIVVVGGATVVVLSQSGNDNSKKVTYYGNGGNSKGEYSIQSTQETVLSGSIFTNEGRYFVSWNTAKDGTGTTYKEGDPVEMGVSLYAQWKPIILFSMDNNIWRSLYHRYIVGEDYEMLADEKGNYSLPKNNPVIEVRPVDGVSATISEKIVFFQGNNASASIGIDPSGVCIKAPEKEGVNVKFAIDTDVYSKIEWSDNATVYTTITYNGNGGMTLDYKTTHSENNRIIMDNMFVKPPTGKVFNGWNTIADGTGSSATVGNNGIFGVTYYAQWRDA